MGAIVPLDLLQDPRFSKWEKCDCGNLNCFSITRKLKCGQKVIIHKHDEDRLLAQIDWKWLFPVPGLFPAIPEVAEVLSQWCNWVASNAGGWLGEDLPRTTIKEDALHDVAIPECLVNNKALKNPKFMDDFDKGLSESGLIGFAVITDPNDATEFATMLLGSPILLANLAIGVAGQLGRFAAGPQVSKIEEAS